MEQKRETSQQIQEFNAAAAKQKRAKDKYEKEQDKLEANNNYSKPSVEQVQKSKDRCQRLEDEKEDMVQLERAISRDIQKHISKLNWSLEQIHCVMIDDHLHCHISINILKFLSSLLRFCDVKGK